MEKFIYRFVTPEAILIAKREASILEKRTRGFRGPVGAIRMSVPDTIEAFLDYFDALGSEGWIFTGMAEYPDLPYGGCYVFRKGEMTTKQIREDRTIKLPVADEKDDDYEISQEEHFKREEDKARERVVLDITRGKKSANPALLEAPAKVVNEIIMRQQRVIQGEEVDIDRKHDVIDELKYAQEMSDEVIPKGEVSDKVVRQQLYQQYQEANKSKKAIWQGKETQGFKSWLDEQRAEYDPLYKQYKAETDMLALYDEKETTEYKVWFKEKMKKDESGQKVQT